jgi:hypothetical protein
MTMKRTELEKRKGLKIVSEQRRSAGRHDRSVPTDRREQRERDRAAGLVPFAVKLHGELVRQLQERAGQRQMALSELVDELLQRALSHDTEKR